MFKIIPDDDKNQAIRVKRFFMAMFSYLIWVLLAAYCYYQEFLILSFSGTVLCFSLVCLTNITFYTILRTGLNKRFKEQSLTVPQMIVGIFWAMIMLYFTNEARGVFLLLFLVIFVFGIFRLKFKQFQFLAFSSIASYGAVICGIYLNRPEQINFKIEIINMVVLGAVLPWFALFGGYLNHIREELTRTKNIVEEMAILDELTGAFNRRQLYTILKREKSLADRSEANFSISMFDIDHFKNVNDTFGHLAGDIILMRIVEEVKQTLRTQDYIARYGGEEFIIVLAYPSADEAVLCSNRIKNIIESLRFEDMPEEFNVTVSFGVTEYHAIESLEETLARVDEALYLAKKNGRNRVECLKA